MTIDTTIDDDTKTRPKPKKRRWVVEETKPALKRPSMYNVVFLNDEYTPMDFVVFVLQKFFGFDEAKANALMWAVHIDGKAIAGTYTFEVAETKQAEVMGLARREGHPLRVVLEKAPEV